MQRWFFRVFFKVLVTDQRFFQCLNNAGCTSVAYGITRGGKNTLLKGSNVSDDSFSEFFQKVAATDQLSTGINRSNSLHNPGHLSLWSLYSWRKKSSSKIFQFVVRITFFSVYFTSFSLLIYLFYFICLFRPLK